MKQSVLIKYHINQDNYTIQTYVLINRISATRHLDDSEAKEAFVQHDDLVLVTAVIHNVAESEQRRHVGQDSAAPHRITLVRDQHLLLISCDGIVQHHWVLIFIRRGEVILQRTGQREQDVGKKPIRAIS